MALTKITSTNIGANAVTNTAIGYTPANKAGDTFTGNIFLTSSTTPNLYIESSNTSVNQNLWFRSNGTDTFGIEAQSNTGGAGAFLSNRSPGGGINLRTTTSGASLQTVMTLDGAGRITTPYQSLAVVGRDGGDVASQTTPIPYNQVITNVGNCWNASTYRFTAQVAGYYYMSINALANNSTGVEVAIRKNGSATVVNTRGYGNGTSCSAAGIIYLAVSDYVDAKVEGSYAMQGGNGYAYSGLTVYLLG